MTLLADWKIRERIDLGDLGIDPFEESLIQPASVDVRLSSVFRIFDNYDQAFIDPLIPQSAGSLVHVAEGEAFVLHPGEFVLGSTVETVRIPPDLAARIEGKSSLGRLGLLLHATAGFIDPGFAGAITLELANVARMPIKLWPGMLIGQLCFLQLSGEVAIQYGDPVLGSRYQGQLGPTASRSYIPPQP